MDETTAKIKAFIVEEFMPDVPVEDLEDDYDLLTGGVVDSLGLLRWWPGSRTSSTSASTTPSSDPTASAPSPRSRRTSTRRATGRMPSKTPSERWRRWSPSATRSRRRSGAISGTGCPAGILHPGEALAVLASLTTRIPDGASVSTLLSSLRERNPRPDPPPRRTVNIVGTGGGPSTFNLSTASAFVGAAVGARVIKTGSRAYASRTGSIDLLDRLGIRLAGSYEQTEESLESFGMALRGTVRLPEGAPHRWHVRSCRST